MLNLFQHPPCHRRAAQVEGWTLKHVRGDETRTQAFPNRISSDPTLSDETVQPNQPTATDGRPHRHRRTHDALRKRMRRDTAPYRRVPPRLSDASEAPLSRGCRVCVATRLPGVASQARFGKNHRWNLRSPKPARTPRHIGPHRSATAIDLFWRFAPRHPMS
jgi:hypothetical protein